MMGTPTLWMPVGVSYPHPSKFFRKFPGTWYLSSSSLNVSAAAGTRVPLVVTLCRSRKAGAGVFPSAPSSVEVRLRLRIAREDESESEPWSESSSPDVLRLDLVLEGIEAVPLFESEDVDFVFSLRAYLKKSRASGSSPFLLSTGLTLLVVEEEPFYTKILTEHKLPTKFHTDIEELDVRLESVPVETCTTSGECFESLH
jgi:hypothetical protein